jgi:hypothetical protein
LNTVFWIVRIQKIVVIICTTMFNVHKFYVLPLCVGPAVDDSEEDEEEDEPSFFSHGKGRGKGRGPNYNSYVPMVFGFYPGCGGGRHGNREDGKAYNPGTATAIANSFSTGRGAVASSHATAYGGPHFVPSGYRRNG